MHNSTNKQLEEFKQELADLREEIAPTLARIEDLQMRLIPRAQAILELTKTWLNFELEEEVVTPVSVPTTTQLKEEVYFEEEWQAETFNLYGYEPFTVQEALDNLPHRGFEITPQKFTYWLRSEVKNKRVRIIEGQRVNQWQFCEDFFAEVEDV